MVINADKPAAYILYVTMEMFCVYYYLLQVILACYRCIAVYQHPEEKVIHRQPSLLNTCHLVYSMCYTQVLLISCC